LIALAKSCLDPDPVNRPRDGGAVDAVIQDFLSSGLRRLERDQIRFFELSLDLFCIAGLDGYFRQINANFSRVLGFAEGDLLSRPFVEFVHPEDEAATLEAVARLKDGQRVVGFANRYRRADGSYVRLEWSSRAVPEEGVIYAVARPVP
jgi:serine/threonine-protein kinase